MELSNRCQLILKLAIQEYIESTKPVASEALVRKYGLLFSSATVRNELAHLEEVGLLTHFHTSAGRVPTDAGYRYFVENLMERAALSPHEQRTIQHQFYQVRGELDQWMYLAAAVLARATHNAAVATPPRAYEARLKHLELIGIYDAIVLLVLVLHDGAIKQQTLTMEGAVAQEELSQASLRLNELLRDTRFERAERLVDESVEPPLSHLERTVINAVARAMRQREGQVNEQLHHDGLLEILAQPEFENVDRVRNLLEILEGGAGLGPLIPQALASDGVQVIIGGEHGRDKMREYSVILSRYGYGDEVAGVVGLIGPTRMAYPRSIGTVRYIATVMSELLAELYGESSGV
ncbi:MAG: heat-inducible transcriptional repressor HrcA [Chloroflexota bacterium]|nr:heat-inducible transcriptional repressor HrcA [Chloroflexota bacterium]